MKKYVLGFAFIIKVFSSSSLNILNFKNTTDEVVSLYDIDFSFFNKNGIEDLSMLIEKALLILSK